MHRRETLFPHPYSLMSPWRLKSLWQLPASWGRPPSANHPPICGLRGRAKAGAPLGPQPLWGQGRMRLASSPSPMVLPPLTIGGGIQGKQNGPAHPLHNNGVEIGRRRMKTKIKNWGGEGRVREKVNKKH